MSDERRTASLEVVLVELGKLSQLAADTRETVNKLDTKVGIQNGRVGKLERWQAFLHGGWVVVVLLILPVVVQFFSKAVEFLLK